MEKFPHRITRKYEIFLKLFFEAEEEKIHKNLWLDGRIF